MKLLPVKSSDIEAIGYEIRILKTIGYKSHDHLLIKFNSGGLYAYLDVPKAKFELMLKADSKGKFFNTEIKNKFKDVKIENQ